MKKLQYQPKKIVKFEKLLISNKNRFCLTSPEKKEIRNDFNNQNILITKITNLHMN